MEKKKKIKIGNAEIVNMLVEQHVVATGAEINRLTEEADAKFKEAGFVYEQMWHAALAEAKAELAPRIATLMTAHDELDLLLIRLKGDPSSDDFYSPACEHGMAMRNYLKEDSKFAVACSVFDHKYVVCRPVHYCMVEAGLSERYVQLMDECFALRQKLCELSASIKNRDALEKTMLARLTAKALSDDPAELGRLADVMSALSGNIFERPAQGVIESAQTDEKAPS